MKMIIKDVDNVGTMELSAFYKLGLINGEQIKEISIALLSRDIETDNIKILASLTKNETNEFSRIELYLHKVIIEFGLESMEIEDAANILFTYYRNEMKNRHLRISEGLEQIKDIYYQSILISKFKDYKYVGDYFKIEHLIGAYWDIDDIREMAINLGNEVESNEIVKIENDVEQYL